MSDDCKGCGKPMKLMSWNSNTDVLTCNNPNCGFFRQPIPAPFGSHGQTLAEELGGVYSRHKRRPKEKKHAESTFEERLQELRDEVSA